MQTSNSHLNNANVAQNDIKERTVHSRKVMAIKGQQQEGHVSLPDIQETVLLTFLFFLLFFFLSGASILGRERIFFLLKYIIV